MNITTDLLNLVQCLGKKSVLEKLLRSLKTIYKNRIILPDLVLSRDCNTVPKSSCKISFFDL